MIVYVGIGLTILLFLVSLIHYFNCARKFADKPNFAMYFVFVQGCVDFWTDVIFSVALFYSKKTMLFYMSLFFLIIPYCISCISCVIWILKWNNYKRDNPIRLIQYLQKYQAVVILFSLMAGFFATIGLLRSKIFYFQIFFFSLKKEEYEKLKYWKFINIIIFENIPQFAIQCMYIISARENDDNQIFLPIAFLSLLLTLISLVFGILWIVTFFCENNVTSIRKQLNCESKITGDLIIECDSLNIYHMYCHGKLQSCLKQVFEASEHSNEWVGCDDVFYHFQVYFLQDEHLLHKLKAYYQLQVLTTESNHDNIINKVILTLNQMINNHSKLSKNLTMQYYGINSNKVVLSDLLIQV